MYGEGHQEVCWQERRVDFLPWLCFLPPLKISNISKSTLRGYCDVNVSISERIFLIEIAYVLTTLLK